MPILFTIGFLGIEHNACAWQKLSKCMLGIVQGFVEKELEGAVSDPVHRGLPTDGAARAESGRVRKSHHA